MNQKLTEQEPNVRFREIPDDEINLADLFLIIWKRKMLIIVVTLLMTLSAVGISLLLPKVYRVDTILEPARDAEGELVENSQSIRENILGGAYNQAIVKKLKIPMIDLPEFKVSVPKQTDLVKISIESSDPQQAVRVLQTLLNEVAGKIRTQLELKRSLAENKLAAAIAVESFFPKQIQQVEEQFKLAENKIVEMERSRKASITNPKNDPMVVLLYLNEIQNQQVFLSSLQEKIVALQKEKELARVAVKTLRLKLAGLKGTNITKQPTMPDKPIKPKKILIVALAFILGLMGGVMLAFMVEFISNIRRSETSEA